MIYLHAREERGKNIAAGIELMVSQVIGWGTKAVVAPRGTVGGEGHAGGTEDPLTPEDRPLGTVSGRSTSKNVVERVTGIEPA